MHTPGCPSVGVGPLTPGIPSIRFVVKKSHDDDRGVKNLTNAQIIGVGGGGGLRNASVKMRTCRHGRCHLTTLVRPGPLITPGVIPLVAQDPLTNSQGVYYMDLSALTSVAGTPDAPKATPGPVGGGEWPGQEDARVGVRFELREGALPLGK